MKRILLILAALLLLVGCGQKKNGEEAPEHFMCYLSPEGNRVMEVPYEPEHTSGEEAVREFTERFNETPGDEEYQRLMPEELSIGECSLENQTLTVTVNGGYEKMERPREILVRAGLVKAFTQISGVDRVVIRTENGELKDSDGNVVGALTKDSFVENTGQEINNYQYTTLTLYFANQTGDRLVPEARSVYYSTSMPLERVVVEQLVKGPKEEGHYPVLPSDTNILSVTTSENIAYVNFDKTFTEGTLSVAQEIPIYALVNSITTNCPVQKVQFSINGESDVTFRESMKLNQFYEKDLSYLEEVSK